MKKKNKFSKAGKSIESQRRFQKMKFFFYKSIIFYTVSFLIIPLAISLIFCKFQFSLDFSNKIGDFLYNSFPPSNKISKSIVIIEINNQSLETLGESPSFGRWPWKRNVYYQLLNYISSCSPKAIIFDLLFLENSEFDQSLVEITSQTENLSHAFYLSKLNEEVDKSKYPNLLKFSKFKDNPLGINESPTHPVLPFKNLLLNAKHLHGVTFSPDRDGVARIYEAGYFTNGFTLPSLAWAAMQLTYPESNLLINKNQIKYSLPTKEISISHNSGKVPIHYYSRDEIDKLERISISDVFYSIYELDSGVINSFDETTIPKNRLQDKVVIIGATASGAHDVHFSPYGELPGSIIQAVAVSNWLEGHFRKDMSLTYEFILYFLISLLSIYAFQKKLSIRYKLAGILFIFLFILCFHIVFFKLNIYFPIQVGIFYLPIYSLFLGIIVPLEERKRRKHTTKVMSKYLSKEVMEEALSKEDIGIGTGTRREITIMFSDLRNFTVLSEALTPEEVVSILNQYLGSMVKCIHKSHGTLDKFIGDAVMAFWNAPIVRENHADLAVQTALNMCYSLRKLNELWKKDGKQTLGMGIGVNTGFAIAGNIGSDERLDYTVIGDTVNLTARIEGLTKDFGSDILITESTLRQLSFIDDLNYRFLGLVNVKGKKENVSLFEIKVPFEGENLDNFKKTKVIFEKAIQLYFSYEYKHAFDLLELILVEFPEDVAARYYLKKAKFYIDNPNLNHDTLQ